MDELPQTMSDASVPAPTTPSLMLRIAVYTLMPVLIVATLPLLLLIILIIYLLAMVHGARVFAFSWSSKQNDVEVEVNKPHFDIQVHEPRAITDQSNPPAKG
ncbi:MAG TPA: hypothetical protein VFE62_03165 [Gemmataceae bacterium]|nr:hypothetical protein [Gemmataceae bacterium]